MHIITKSELTALSNSNLGYRDSNTVLKEAKAQNKYTATVSIFLSHSHYDKVEVAKAVIFLRSLGITVYVDWQDDTMPVTTSGETAKKIKEKIDECKKFILLATNTAIASKWCNWELGFGDAKKYLEHIALFPVADSLGDWTGNEYLQIYPRIEKNDFSNEFYVIYPSGLQKTLKEWLRN